MQLIFLIMFSIVMKDGWADTTADMCGAQNGLLLSDSTGEFFCAKQNNPDDRWYYVEGDQVHVDALGTDPAQAKRAQEIKEKCKVGYFLARDKAGYLICSTDAFAEVDIQNPAVNASTAANQAAFSACESAYQKSEQQCGESARANTNSVAKDAVEVAARVVQNGGAAIGMTCNQNYQMFNAGYAAVDRFTNSCGPAVQDCFAACGPLMNDPVLGEGATTRFNNCQKSQHWLVKAKDDEMQLANSMNTALQCANQSSLNTGKFGIDCSNPALSQSPDCMCASAANKVACVTSLLSKGSDLNNSLKPVDPNNDLAKANPLKDTAPPYTEPKEQWQGNPFSPKNSPNTDSGPRGGTIGGGGGGAPPGGGGQEPPGGPGTEGESTKLNAGISPTGSTPGLGRSGFGPAYKNGLRGLPTGAEDPRKPDPSKWGAGIPPHLRGIAGTGDVTDADGVGKYHRSLIKMGQQGYRNSEAKNYFRGGN